MSVETTAQAEVETLESEEEPVTPTPEPETAAEPAKPAAEPATPEAPKEDKIPRYVAVQVNPEQYQAIKTFAQGKALSGVCLQILADTIGFKVEETVKAARGKYATPAEREAAAKQRREDDKLLKDFLLQQNKDKLAEMLVMAKAAKAAREADAAKEESK